VYRHFIARSLIDAKAFSIWKLVDQAGVNSPSCVGVGLVSSQTFSQFLTWLDCDTVDNPTSALDTLYIPYKRHSWSRLLPIFKIYLFGELFEIPQLCQDALYQIFKYLETHLEDLESRTSVMRSLCNISMAVKEISFIYKATDFGSQLRAIFVDCFCAMDMENTCAATRLLEYPKQFLVDVMARRATLRGFKSNFTDAALWFQRWEPEDVETFDEASKKRKREDQEGK
jgi:hypothetical protein